MRRLKYALLVSAALLGVACNGAIESSESISFLEKEIILTATREKFDPDTRSIRLDDGSVWWGPKEEISVFYGSGTDGGSKFTSSNTTLAETAEFEGSISMSGSKEFWAIYPYSTRNSCDGSSIITVIPAQQIGSEGNFADDAFPAVGRSNSLSMPFYNICGGVKFFVSRGDIKYVTFKGNNDEPLAGKVKVTFSSDGIPVVAEVVEPSTEVTLTAPEGGTFKAGKYYYITLLPGALDAGFTIKFNTSNSCGVLSSANPQVVKRSSFGVLKNADSGAQTWEDFEKPSISVTPSELLFEIGEYNKSIKLLATRDWTVSRSVDWASVDVNSGMASNLPRTLNVSVQINPEYDREGEIVFSIGGDIAVLAIKQVGEKGEIPLGSVTVADFIKSDGSTYYRLSGVISGFITGTNSRGKNYMQFNLTDATGTILVYDFTDGEYEKWADTIKDGGTVVLTGVYQYYERNSQHEVVKATIESYEDGVPPTEFEQLTVAEFISKADPSAQYRLAGVVEDYKITNQDKGYMEFYLKDATGRILVYSLADGDFDKWSEKLADGGNIVLVGSYKLYDNNPEVVKATIESFEANPDYKYCRIISSTSIKIGPSVTGETITIQSNAAWTVTSSNPAASASPASGEGDATVQLTLPVNDKDTEVSYEFVVKSEAAGFEGKVTVTQKKAGSSNYDPIVLTFPDENKDANKVSSYEKNWTAKIGDYTWTIGNFNNNNWSGWAYIKCGRKNNDSTGMITLDQSVPYPVVSVVVTIDKISDASKVNTTKLLVASDSAFSNVVATVEVKSVGDGDITYAVPAPAANLYYRLMFDCSSHSANGIIQISKVVYSVE